MKNYLYKYKSVIGLLISLIFLYLSLTKINFNDIVKLFSKSSSSIIIFVFLLAFLVRIIIAFRWHLLLHFTEKRKFRDTFIYLNIGYLINDVFPARIGDFVKSYLLAKKENISKTDTLASVIVERLFDITGMGLIFLLALSILDLPSYTLKGGVILISLCMLGFLSLLFLALNKPMLSNFQKKFSSKKVLNWILVKVNKLSVYSNFLINIRLTFSLLFLTIIIWFIYLFSGYIIIENLHPSQFSWHAAVLSLLFISIAFVIPSTPGNIGVYQYACIIAFEVTGAGYTKEEALVFSLISQLPVYFLTLFLGMYSAYLEGFKLGKLKKFSEDLETVKS